MKQKKMNLADYDDEAIDIMYQWAQCAILCRTPQVQHMIPTIINEYQYRHRNEDKPGKWKVKIADMWVYKYEISRVKVCDDESKAQIFAHIDWVKNFAPDNEIEIIKVEE